MNPKFVVEWFLNFIVFLCIGLFLLMIYAISPLAFKIVLSCIFVSFVYTLLAKIFKL